MSAEAKELWEKYAAQKSPEVKEELILHYVPLVRKIANKTIHNLPGNYSREDLYTYGVFGLIEAVDRFDPYLGYPFETFAIKRIKGAIIDGIRKEDWIPWGIRKKARLVEQAYHKLESVLQRSATDEEVARELNISLEEYNNWLKNIRFVSVVSLDEPLLDSESGLLIDCVPNDLSPNPVQLSEEKEIKKILAKAVEELPEKEKLVISLFYYHDLSNKEIAQVMEISDSRVSQLHTKAVFRLRGKLARMKKAF